MADELNKQMTASAKRHLSYIVRDVRAQQQLASRLNAKIRAGTIDYRYANAMRSRLRAACTNATQNLDRMASELHSLSVREQQQEGDEE